MTSLPAQEAPSGRVTLLFTDVEGSTAGWERFGDRFGAALRIHDSRMREAIAHHGGYLVKTAGDAFMVAFGDAAAAVACAVEMQARLAEPADDPAWEAVGGIRARIGLHTGEPDLRDGDYFGPPVNRAARICDAGHGGVVLLSQAVADALPGSPPGFAFADRGRHRLKDLGEPERLYELRPDRAAPSDRPLRTLEALQHNFPAQITSLVGRARERDELNRLLGRADCRLVTLIGPGGTGKTRLAMQVAADRLQAFTGGVWLVELAAVSDAGAVAPAIALALRLDLSATSDPKAQLVEFLRPRRSLLVLDNFEQVAEAARLLGDLLRDCPQLVCLVTSRELLRIAGEQEYAVEPLSVPPAGKTDNHWEQYDSVQLFVERAQASRSDFALTPITAPAVGEICRRLDGIPLAIELAAARTRGMTPPQILLRLTRRFDLLASAQRDLPERQRTLRSAIDWSYDLLTEDERALFAEMSVFPAGATLEAAEEVCLTPGAFDLLFSVRDKSLLKTDEVNGETRYRMLETLREYALEKLETSGRAAELRARHAACFLRRAQGWCEAIAAASADAPAAMDAFTADLDNVRAGMDWCAQQDHAEPLIEYAKAMFPFLRRRGLYREADARLATAEAAARAKGDEHALARLLNQLGLVAMERSELEAAGARFAESYETSRRLRDEPRMLVPLINLGNTAWMSGAFDRARSAWEEALALASRTGQPRYEAYIREDLGILDCQQGNYERAGEHFDQSLAMHRASADQKGMASTLYNSSEVFRRRGDLDEAMRRVVESQRLYHALGDQRGIALTSVRVGLIDLEAGRLGQVRVHAEEGLRIARELGDRHAAMYALDLLGRLHAAEGARADGIRMFSDSFALGRDVGDRRHMADTILHAGEMLAQDRDWQGAVRLFGIAAREYARLGIVDSVEADTLLNSAARCLPEADRSRALEEAAAVPLNDALADLLARRGAEGEG